MAIPYVTGPVHIYVSQPTGTFVNSSTGAPSALTTPSTIYYLGTGEQAPTIRISKMFAPVMNDIGGEMAPIDSIYQGTVAQVSVTLNRWNEYVFTLLDQATQTGGLGRGRDDDLDMGTLSITEGNTFYCWLQYPYYRTSGARSGFYDHYMPAGFRFYACQQFAFDISPGTKAKRRLFAFEALRVFSPSNGRMLLYDHTMTYGSNTALPEFPPEALTGVVS